MATQEVESETKNVNPLNEEFQKLAKEVLEEYHVPGLSIAVIDGNQVYTESFGYATLPDTKATADTLWFAGSTTKAQTCATLARLIDSKKHPALADGWSTKISSLIRDDFVVQDEWATNHITLDDAAAHRSGMGRHDLSLRSHVEGRPATARDHTRSMRHLKMTAEPRVKGQYSNHMYMALSLAIEAVTGHSLGDSFREALWHPLGMKSTYYGEKEAEKAAEHLATGYRWDGSANKFESVPLDLLEMSAGAGAIASSINDYAKWIQCLLQESDVLSKEAHAEIRKPGIIWGPSLDPHGDLTTYGKGWLRKLYHGQVIYSHGGGCSHGTEVYWLPGKKFGIVTMGNTYKTANFVGMILAHKLLDDKLDVAEGDRVPYRTILKQQEEKDRDNKNHALENFYPNRSKPAMPSTGKLEDLEGSYHDDGYGTLQFEKREADGDEVLVAERTDLWLNMRYTLHHVSGDYWLLQLLQMGSEGGIELAIPAEIRYGVDGKSKEVVIHFENKEVGVDDGTVVFERVAGPKGEKNDKKV